MFKIKINDNSNIKLILKFSEIQLKEEIKFEIEISKNSSLNYIDFSNLTPQIKINYNFNLAKDSNLNASFISLAKDSNLSVFVNLLNENANASINGIVASSFDNNQKSDIYLNHLAPNTTGNINLIGIANMNGKAILNGISKIKNGMKNANSYQKLKGILLSNFCEVNVNPILLIDEYDVKAGHAASVGRIEEEALFYLQSRGINKKDAYRLIINGMLVPFYERLDDDFKKIVETKINERIDISE